MCVEQQISSENEHIAEPRRPKPLCVKGVFLGFGRGGLAWPVQGAGLVLVLGLGPGSDLSEEPAFQDVEPVTLDLESFLSVLPDPFRSGCCGASGICDEVLVDPIGDLPFQRPDGFLAGFAFCDLFVVVGAALAGITELADSGDVDGVVEFPVPSWVETMPRPVA